LPLWLSWLRFSWRLLRRPRRGLAIGYRLAQDARREILRIDRQGRVDFLERKLDIAGFARGACGFQMKLERVPLAG
jgi:hypothetical protein